MLGDLKTPNGVANSTPPESRKRSFSSAPGAAWHDAHPPAQKINSPFFKSALCAGT